MSSLGYFPGKSQCSFRNFVIWNKVQKQRQRHHGTETSRYGEATVWIRCS